MKKILHLSLATMLFLVLSCSDGIQVSQKISTIIKDNKLEQLVIIDNNKESKKFNVKEITIENQLLISGDEYINLGRVKSFKVKGKALEIIF